MVTTYEQLSPLGQETKYSEQHDPTLLFGVPRDQQRKALQFSDTLPFQGVDLWNGYELSWLNTKGKPLVATIIIAVPATSPNLIESKSLKLYLNSLNQTQFDSHTAVLETIVKDLSQVAKEAVQVTLTPQEEWEEGRIVKLEGENIDNLDVTIETYEVSANLLSLEKATAAEQVQETLCSNLLKSNCLVTGQPDWASIIVRYEGPKIQREALLKYIVSYRNHQGFHEQCVEQIFVDIQRACNPKKLTVYARYTRRGGLDINPFRSNYESLDTADQTSCIRLHRQ